MGDKPKITRIETASFTYEVPDLRVDASAGVVRFSPGDRATMGANAIRVHTDAGITGEYVGGSAPEYAGIPTLLPSLLGRDALERELIYRETKHASRQQARMGMSVVDIALWDIAGKFYEQPVHRLLGGDHTSLPAYASTYVGDDHPDGLSSPEAYADFAERCYELGYRAFKIHGWYGARPVADEVACIEAVGERVGDRMVLMYDASSVLETFGDAWRVGRACDAYGYFWLEDPFQDGGVSAQAHAKLRELIRTPLLQGEHMRGLETKVDLIVSQGTDFVRGDPEFDGGITGAMKLAHAAEGFGLDIELHMAGPARRQVMAALMNSNYYEMGLVHPVFPTLDMAGPVYASDYADELDAVDADGRVPVSDLPGLGVVYDWDHIEANRVGGNVYE